MKNLIVKRSVIILGVITFLAFLLRFFTTTTEVLYPDSCLYLSFAKSILNGNFFVDFRYGVKIILPPLYALLNAVFAIPVGDVELAGVLVSTIAGAFLIIPVFYLTKAIYSEKAAWVSAILVFLNTILIHWSGAILTESLFITLFVSGIASGYYAIENKSRVFFFISGTLIGLSYMTRVIGLVAIPVVGLWIMIYFLIQYKSGNKIFALPWKEVIISFAVFFLGFIIVTAPYIIRINSFYDHWTITGTYNVTGTISSKGVETASEWEKRGKVKVEEGFYKRFIEKVIINLKNYSSSMLGMLLFAVIFIIAGLLPRWKILYVVSFILAYFAVLLVLPLSPFSDERIRYLSPILPLFLIMASVGITRIHGWIRWGMVKEAAIPVMIGIVLISSVLHMKMFPIGFNNFWNTKNSVDMREKAGIWMKEKLPHPIRAMSRKPYIPYYADAIWFQTPETYDEVITLANSKGIDYIVVDRAIDFYLRPKLRFLFDPAQVPEDLKFIGGLRHPETGGLYIGLYKINRNTISKLRR